MIKNLIQLHATGTNGISTFRDLGGDTDECTIKTAFPYNNFRIKDGVSYPDNKYVKYDDLINKLNPGVQSAGTYLLSDGSILSSNTTLTTDQKSKVRALSIGDMSDGLSRWIACGGNLTSVTTYTWCTAYPVGYDTGSGYITSDSTAITRKDGKSLTNTILNSTTSHGYDFNYFPALNLCYSFDFGITGVSQGDGYLMAPKEHQQWMNQSTVWTNWKNVTGNDLPGASGYGNYWSSLQTSANYSWTVLADNGSYNGLYTIIVDNSYRVLPCLCF